MSTDIKFDSTLGALFVGFSVSTFLYGILFVQMYNYCRRYPADKIWYKVIVMLLVILETVHQIFIGHAVYYYTITNFLNILALYAKPIWSLVFQLLVGAVVGTIVRFFFSLRVWRFSKGNVWLTGLLMLLNFGQLGLAIVFTVKSYALPALPDLSNLRLLGTITLGVGVLNDIGIAAALCYYLQTMRSTYAHADSLIRNLTIYAVNTGVLTSAVSFSTVVIYNCMPKNFIFVGCYFVLSKLYAVSFVAALNTRQIIRGRGTDGEVKKSSMVTGSRSLSLPLHTHDVVTTHSQDTMAYTENERIGASPPDPDIIGLAISLDSVSTAHQDISFAQAQDKPHYPVGDGGLGNYI